MKTVSAILWLTLVALTGFSAPPQLDSIWPPGGQQGTEIELTLSGKLDPWPCQLHFSGKGFSFTPDPEKKGTGKLKIGKEVPPGPIMIRALNEEGTTPPRFFLVGKVPEILEEDADKNTIEKAQPIDVAKLPLVINGKIPANNELDSFRLTLKKGETLHAAVEGYTLLSLIDPVLHVYNEDGNRLQLAHDSAVHLDPRLDFTAPSDGGYVITVAGFAHPPAASVYFRGDKKAQYRLHLARKKEDLPSRLLPQNPGPDLKGNVIIPGKPAVGTLSKPGETDQFKLNAKKDQQYLVKVEASSLGFPTDPVLGLIKPDGTELRMVDDSNKENDPEYLWKISADGEYGITVTDRFRRGGPDFRYRVQLEEPKSAFTATVEKSEYLIEQGKSVDIKVTIGRLHGNKSDLTFAIPKLPKSVTLTPPEKVPEKGGEVILKLEAQKDAAPFNQAISLQVSEKPAEGEKAGAPQTAVFSFKDANYRGPYVIMETPSIWLTIPPPKKKEPKKEEKEKKP